MHIRYSLALSSHVFFTVARLLAQVEQRETTQTPENNGSAAELARVGSVTAPQEVESQDVLAAPTLSLQVGHASSINSIAFSPNGHLLASGSDDRAVKLWDVKSGRLLRTFWGIVTK